ncbi:MAG: RNA polymerase sigma factor, partial [Gracilibacteraceae bacterium]|nr:RNA polymerase sigma factor [Gracilibacteraceae bacterium]
MKKEAASIFKQNVPDSSGEELYRRFVEGDTKAFEQLVGLYELELSQFISGMIRDSHETKHLVIETFAQLAASAGQFKGASSLKTYLFTIAKNLTMRLLKKRGREKHLSLEDVLQEAPRTDEALEALWMRKEIREMLHAAMQKLKMEHREVLLLLYMEEMSYREAGRVMVKSERQIEGLAYRAKAALKKVL